MKFIEELVVEEFLPTVRSMLATALRDRGLTQTQVADALGISQSAVSKYAHGNITGHDAIAHDPRVRELVDRLADDLATGDRSREHALVELERFIRQLEHGDLLAHRHQAVMPGLAEADAPVEIHDPDSRLLAAERVLTDVRRGLRILRNTPGFLRLIPNVGSNLVQSLPDAATVDDVAGVPGRLFPVNDQLSVPADPEFGASGHVATVLLATRAAGAPARAALNIRYDPAVLERLEDTGHSAVAFDPEFEAVRGAIQAVYRPGADVLYHTGAFGIEPIVYVLAADAPDAARTIRAVT